MKLSSLRYFVTIAKYKSYTKASENLFISQPTLSRTIMDLEEELGIKLFVRGKSNLHLTEEGKILYREASEIIEKCDRLPILFHPEASESEETAVIRIGYQTSMNIRWAWPVFNTFMKENPKCRIVVEHAPGPELSERLMDGQYDMIIAFESTLPSSNKITSAKAGHSRLQVAVHENSKLAGLSDVGMMDLENENFILIDRRVSPEVLDRVIARCIMNGFSPHASVYVRDLREGLEHVSMGEGITFIHTCMREEGMEEQYPVRFLDLKDAVFDSDIVLGWMPEKETKYMRKLAEMIQKSQEEETKHD